jgi:hypothetical protein
VIVLGRRTKIAIEAHYVGDIPRVGDDPANELGLTVPFGLL